MTYFEAEDVLHLVLSDEPEANSVEFSPNVTAKINAAGELTAVEILTACTFPRTSVLASTLARSLRLQRLNTSIERSLIAPSVPPP